MYPESTDHDLDYNYDPNQPTPRRIIGGIALGTLGAIVGAAIWTLVVLKAHIETGMIALLIGALVGGGVSFGSQRSRGLYYQLIAGSLAIVGYAIAKIMIIAMVAPPDDGLLALLHPANMVTFAGLLVGSMGFFDLLWAVIAAAMASSMLKNG